MMPITTRFDNHTSPFAIEEDSMFVPSNTYSAYDVEVTRGGANVRVGDEILAHDSMAEETQPNRLEHMYREMFTNFTTCYKWLLTQGSSPIGVYALRGNTEFVLLEYDTFSFLTDGTELHMHTSDYGIIGRKTLEEFEKDTGVTVVVVEDMSHEVKKNISFWDSGKLDLDLNNFFTNKLKTVRARPRQVEVNQYEAYMDALRELNRTEEPAPF